jgi:hypothetical protein
VNGPLSLFSLSRTRARENKERGPYTAVLLPMLE